MPYLTPAQRRKWATAKTAGRLARQSGLAKKFAKQVVAPFTAAGVGTYAYGKRKTSAPKVVIGRARRVVRITRGPAKRKGPVPTILSKHKKLIPKKYPQRLTQVYYVQSSSTYSDLEPGKQGTITNPDQIYFTPSTDPTNASIMLFNVSVTENHWFPRGLPAAQGLGYRTGNQLVGIDDQLPGWGSLPGVSERLIYLPQ